MKTISAQHLYQKLNDGEPLVLLDVREPWEYELCHLPDSINISLSVLASRLTELATDAETVIICHHGIRSAEALRYLSTHGFNNISHLDGGIDSWARTVATEMSRY